MKFAWYDLWVGAYIDQAKRTLYICPLPTLLVAVRLRTTEEAISQVLASDRST